MRLTQVEFRRLLPSPKVPEFLDHLGQLTIITKDGELTMNRTNPTRQSLLTLLAVLTLVDTGIFYSRNFGIQLLSVIHHIQVALVVLREQRQLRNQSMIRTRRTRTLPNQRFRT